MVAKGHDFPNVTLVGILSADAMLATGDYRASERTFQLLAQAAGRAGRAGKPGRVVIQAYNVDDYSLQAVLTHDYAGFYRQEISMRQKLWLPPFCHIGMVILSCAMPDVLEKLSRGVSDFLVKQAETYAGIVISEVMPAPMPLLSGRHRVRILVRHTQVRVLRELLSSLLDTMQKPLAASDADIVVDIDPGSMV
jgi:primosomal protein N' (replication factor Y)